MLPCDWMKEIQDGWTGNIPEQSTVERTVHSTRPISYNSPNHTRSYKGVWNAALWLDERNPRWLNWTYPWALHSREISPRAKARSNRRKPRGVKEDFVMLPFDWMREIQDGWTEHIPEQYTVERSVHAPKLVQIGESHEDLKRIL